MSPTVFRWRRFRFYFFSREEPRMHVHVRDADGQAKVWLEPEIEVAANYGLPAGDLRDVVDVVREREQEIRDAWNEHFSS